MAVRPFAEMRELVFQYHVTDLGAFPPELLLAIFWHESRFQNIRQIHEAGQAIGGHGMGFGQVERRVVRMVNHQFRTSYPIGPLTDQQSIEVTGLTLRLHLTFPTGTSAERALHAYATGRRPTGRAWQPGPTVRGWQGCASGLMFLRDLPLPASYGDPQVVRSVWSALRLTVPSSKDFELSRALPMPAADR